MVGAIPCHPLNEILRIHYIDLCHIHLMHRLSTGPTWPAASHVRWWVPVQYPTSCCPHTTCSSPANSNTSEHWLQHCSAKCYIPHSCPTYCRVRPPGQCGRTHWRVHSPASTSATPSCCTGKVMSVMCVQVCEVYM